MMHIAIKLKDLFVIQQTEIVKIVKRILLGEERMSLLLSQVFMIGAKMKTKQDSDSDVKLERNLHLSNSTKKT